MIDPRGLADAWPEASVPVLHGSCCHVAREWMRGMDRSLSLTHAGHLLPPLWLRERYEWGPQRWPVAWCDLPDSDTLDCGAFSFVTTDLYRARGEAASAVQLIFRYPQQTVDFWQALWTSAGCSSQWIRGHHIYHEATALFRRDGKIEIWDSSVNTFLASSELMSNPIVAMRVSADAPGVTLHWDGHPVTAGRWCWLE